MTTTRTTGAVITEIIEAYHAAGAGWVRISRIAQERNLTPAEVKDAIIELMEDHDSFRAEPEPFVQLVTEADKTYGPVIGGEARHLIEWR
jgi:hypothetical protein